jgi:hypothetical protein
MDVHYQRYSLGGADSESKKLSVSQLKNFIAQL